MHYIIGAILLRYMGDIRNAAMLIATFKPITMNHAAIAIRPARGAYHLRNLLVVSVNKFVYSLNLQFFSCTFADNVLCSD